MNDLANYPKDQGLPAGGSNDDSCAAAKLVINRQSFIIQMVIKSQQI